MVIEGTGKLRKRHKTGIKKVRLIAWTFKRLNGHEYAFAYMGKDVLFFENGANAFTGTAIVATAPESSVRIEDKGVGVEIVLWVLCRQPVIADLADVAVFFIPAAASSGQKDVITIYNANRAINTKNNFVFMTLFVFTLLSINSL